MIRVVVRYDATKVDPERLADELVRRGARDAHGTTAGAIAISVVARSYADAAERTRSLLAHAGATEVRVEPLDPPAQATSL